MHYMPHIDDTHVTALSSSRQVLFFINAFQDRTVFISITFVLTF